LDEFDAMQMFVRIEDLDRFQAVVLVERGAARPWTFGTGAG
jgi:hypothetical protein